MDSVSDTSTALALTPEERDLILAVRAEQAKRDAGGWETADMEEPEQAAPTATPAAGAVAGAG